VRRCSPAAAAVLAVLAVAAPAWAGWAEHEAEALAFAGDDARLGRAVESLFAKPTREKMETLIGVASDRKAKAAEIVAFFLDHQSPFKRVAAVWALEKNPDVAGRLAPKMAPLLKDGDPDIRWNTLKALGNLGNRDVASVVAVCTKDKVGRVRWMAAKALGQLGEAKYAPDVAKLLWDPDKNAHLQAALALGKLTGQDWQLWTPDLVAVARKWWQEHEGGGAIDGAQTGSPDVGPGTVAPARASDRAGAGSETEDGLSDVERGIIIGIVSIAVLAITVIVARGRMRRRAWKSLGDQMGFSFVTDREDLGRRFDFDFFSKDRGGHAPCMLSGKVGGSEVILADYAHVSPTGVNETKTHAMTICIASHPALDLPRTILWPEIHLSGLAARIADKLGVRLEQDIDFDDHSAFSEAFVLQSEDESAARAAYSARVRQHFAANQNLFADRVVETAGNAVLVIAVHPNAVAGIGLTASSGGTVEPDEAGVRIPPRECGALMDLALGLVDIWRM